MRKPFLAVALTAVAAASAIIMVGPQITLIAPLAIVLGGILAYRRSWYSLVCIGYPLLFGFISAWIGFSEMPGYEQTMAFAVSIGIGLIGCGLVAVGLSKALPA
jgi:hypothetical protein